MKPHEREDTLSLPMNNRNMRKRRRRKMRKCLRPMMKRRREKTLLMMNVLATTSFSSSSSSSWVSPSCRPARNNTICFQSEQKSETIFHQNGKYQISHLPRFIKQDLGESLGIIFWYSPGRSRYNKPAATLGPTSYIPNMDRHCPAGRRIGDTEPISDLKPLFNQNQVFITFLMTISARPSLIRSDQCDEPRPLCYFRSPTSWPNSPPYSPVCIKAKQRWEKMANLLFPHFNNLWSIFPQRISSKSPK